MKNFAFLFLAAYFLSCSAAKEDRQSSTPKLISQNQLPPIPAGLNSGPINLDAMLHIMENGTIDEVHISKGTTDPNWNAQAEAIMRQWRFLPAVVNDKPVPTWYHLQTVIRFAEPVNYSLAEIVCRSAADGDSVYADLKRGVSFEKLVKAFSIDSSSLEHAGKIGMTNIYSFPEELRNPIQKLDVNDFTQPISYGNRFYVFQRLKE
jgi:TonB family protein